MNRWIRILGVGILLAIAAGAPAPASADQYRNALKKYWKQFFRGEGIVPLFYASSAHQPKTIWEQSSSAMDFYSSGEELFPSAYVPMLTARIGLGDVKRSGEMSASIALQLAGIRSIEDAKLKAAASNEYSWSITMRDPEMHFIALRDANRCVMHVTGQARKSYFEEMADSNHRLLVITRAVFVGSYEVTVSRASNAALDVNADLTKDLVAAGFKIDAKGKSATLLAGKGMYLAAGFRTLRKEGAPVGAGGDGRAQLLPLEEEIPDFPPTELGEDGAWIPPFFD